MLVSVAKQWLDEEVSVFPLNISSLHIAVRNFLHSFACAIFLYLRSLYAKAKLSFLWLNLALKSSSYHSRVWSTM